MKLLLEFNDLQTCLPAEAGRSFSY